MSDPHAVQRMICTSELGYMTNTGGQRLANNVRVVPLQPTMPRGGNDAELSWLFLVATRKIARYEELLSSYNNPDSRAL